MITVLRVLYGCGLLALALILGQRYRATKNIGYILLGLALPVWPLLSWLSLEFLQDQITSLLATGGGPAGQVVTTLGYIEKLVRVMLIIAGFAVLRTSPNPPEAGPLNPVRVLGS